MYLQKDRITTCYTIIKWKNCILEKFFKKKAMNSYEVAVLGGPGPWSPFIRAWLCPAFRCGDDAQSASRNRTVTTVTVRFSRFGLDLTEAAAVVDTRTIANSQRHSYYRTRAALRQLLSVYRISRHFFG